MQGLHYIFILYFHGGFRFSAEASDVLDAVDGLESNDELMVMEVGQMTASHVGVADCAIRRDGICALPCENPIPNRKRR